MFSIMRTIGLAVCTLVAAQAAEFGPLLEVTRATWPGKNHLAVIAQYSRSAEAIAELASAAGEGMLITVLDCPNDLKIDNAMVYLKRIVRPDLLVLLPEDPLVHDGCFDATRVVNRAAQFGLPTLATTGRAIDQGAVLAIGPETGMELLLTNRLKGTVDVVLPSRVDYLGKVSLLRPVRSMAEVRVVVRD